MSAIVGVIRLSKWKDWKKTTISPQGKVGEKSIKRTNSSETYLGNSSFEERQACKYWNAFYWIKYCSAARSCLTVETSLFKTCIFRIERCDDKNVYWLTLQKLLSAFLTLLPVVWEKNLGRNIKTYLEIEIKSLVKIGYISLNMLLFHSNQQLSILKN